MTFFCKYVALYVPDLRAAEDFYRGAFGLELLFRESEKDGEWWALPAGREWDEAHAAGVEIGMIALRRENLLPPAQLFECQEGPLVAGGYFIGNTPDGPVVPAADVLFDAQRS